MYLEDVTAVVGNLFTVIGVFCLVLVNQPAARQCHALETKAIVGQSKQRNMNHLYSFIIHLYHIFLLVVKSKLLPRIGSSLEAVELHP